MAASSLIRVTCSRLKVGLRPKYRVRIVLAWSIRARWASLVASALRLSCGGHEGERGVPHGHLYRLLGGAALHATAPAPTLVIFISGLRPSR